MDFYLRDNETVGAGFGITGPVTFTSYGDDWVEYVGLEIVGAAVGDVVKIYDGTDTNDFIYGVLKSIVAPTPPDTNYTYRIGYDSDVYTLNVANGYKLSFFSEDVTVKAAVSNSHSMTTTTTTAVYSNQYIRYNVKRAHGLKINNLRRNFYGDFKDILDSAYIYAVDTCYGSSGDAYKVFIGSDTTESVNNKFKKSVPFKIAHP